jgi:predicted Zn-dependent protease
VFDNGLPLGAVRWIDGGRLSNLASTRHTAREAGLEHRPMVDNLVLDVAGATGSLAELIERTEDALLVTCLWYNRVVDPQTLLLTGLTRDGVYVVRGGEVVGAASNFRFNDSPVDVLTRIEDAGAGVATLAREMADYFPRAVMPPLLVRDYNFSTRSQAS